MDKPVEKVAKPVSKTTKLDEHTADSIKEKSYTTRQVDTSISILESPEDEVVLESLLFLSKYADIKISNLTYLQQKGITMKLLNLLNRNICIIRLCLRLLDEFLKNTSIICELDQDIYDDKIIEISDLYINHVDRYVRQFCVNILSKLAQSCRITCLIFKVDLFAPILETIKQRKDSPLIIAAMELLDRLLESPAGLASLLVLPNFDVNAITSHLFNEETDVAEKAYQLIIKLSSQDVRAFQKMFRENQLVEKMLDVVMDPTKSAFHQNALKIIQNCVNSEETSTYFIKTIQFLSFCVWVKYCDNQYLLPCADIFETLSGIPSIKQILYDLSVEESILYFLRSKDKNVINKACNAITNMTVHKYCCEDMLTPVVLKTLIEILQRKDDEVDPSNEVALETIYSFFIRTPKAMVMLYSNDIVPILFEYFTKVPNLSKESYLRVIEMLYRYSMISDYQHSVIGDVFFENLIKQSISDSEDLAQLSLEILIHFIGNKTFNDLFLSMNGPKFYLDMLTSLSNTKILKFVLLFIHNAMMFEELSKHFLKSGLMATLKALSPSFTSKAPIINTIINLSYNVYLPMKFHKTGKIDLTNKLGNRFYIINGRINGPFPFLEIIETQKLCTFLTIYVIDYCYKPQQTTVVKQQPIATETKVSHRKFGDQNALDDSYTTSKLKHETYSDIYLLRYIKHVEQSIEVEWALEEKISFLAKYVDEILCGPIEDDTKPAKIHTYKLHIECLKNKLCSNIIPVGYLRIGFHCEKSLLFKAIADMVNIPCTLQYYNKIYWNEVALFETTETGSMLRFYIVDLMNDISALLPVGSREANKYLKNATQ